MIKRFVILTLIYSFVGLGILGLGILPIYLFYHSGQHWFLLLYLLYLAMVMAGLKIIDE